jgi:hypothetical protein
MGLGTRTLPLIGILLGIAALCLWVAPIALSVLDAVVLSLFGLGLVLSLLGYVLGPTVTVRRAAVVGIGLNGVGAIVLGLLYVW